ncbi:MAG: hypothetical protein ACTHNE_13645 [Dyella sp.]|uniref:hypothetical protein n=1 Tax=Dyella sp. TaxID=1869338 RepID=UPI003F7F9EB4
MVAADEQLGTMWDSQPETLFRSESAKPTPAASVIQSRELLTTPAASNGQALNILSTPLSNSGQYWNMVMMQRRQEVIRTWSSNVSHWKKKGGAERTSTKQLL